MKELSIEEKAKAYDEALKQIKECTPDENGFITIYPNEIFPELKESEDEKIRKALISHFVGLRDNVLKEWNGIKVNNIIAWLEKQGKETSWKPSKEEMDVLYGLAYITNQYDEHKEEVITRLYQDLKREFFNGSSYENMFPNTEDGVRRRSTIQVLEYARSLDTYNQYGKADIDKNIAWLEKQGEQKSADKVEPKFKVGQTIKKEGFNLGFTIVKIEDGFYYNDMGDHFPFTDQDNWELVEQKSAWSEEDEDILNTIINHFKVDIECTDEDDMVRWLKSIKDRVQPKREWSEEDEKMIQDIINDIAIAQEQVYCKSRCEDEINWLKSLRPQNWTKEDKERYISCLQRLSTGDPKQPETINSKWFKEHVYPQPTWKPSDGQIKALKEAADEYWEPDGLDPLYTLYQDLKKLRGE